MSDKIKAIQTVYKGYKFRSRLEARWAVFFDALAEKSTMAPKWTYEPEGFDLDGVYYLPDFRVDYGVHTAYIEIKGKKPTDDEILKGKKLASHLKQPFYFLCDIPSPDLSDYIGITFDGLCFIPSNVSFIFGNDAHFYVFDYYRDQLPDFLKEHGFPADKDSCFKYDADYFYKKHSRKHPNHCSLGRISTIGCDIPFFLKCCLKDHLSAISYAATKARQARFEHGEKP